MSTFSLIFIATGVAALAMLAGGLLSHRFAHFLSRHSAPVVAFASGAMLMITFGHVLPESVELAGGQSFGWILAGVLLFYFLEHFILLHSCPDHLGEHACKNHSIGPIAAIGLGLHSFFDGLLIVFAFLVQPELGLLTTVGIALHKLPNGAILHSLLCLGTTKRSLIYVLLVALATPLAGLLAPTISVYLSSAEVGLGLAFSAGALLYITLSDLLPRTHEKRSYHNLVWLLLGGLLIFGLQHIGVDLHGDEHSDEHPLEIHAN